MASWEPSLYPACLPFPPSSLCVPYCKDLLSDGHHVQAAVEVLNPLAQFFFPGSDKGKEVICSHHLVGAQREDTSGTRQNHHKCRDKVLSWKDNSCSSQAPSLVKMVLEEGRGWHWLFWADVLRWQILHGWGVLFLVL